MHWLMLNFPEAGLAHIVDRPCALHPLAALLSIIVVAPAIAGPVDSCCADIEQRIAELEDMTARRGNDKVSLEVSGQINEAILFWYDGKEADAYVVTNENSRTRFRFKGSAKIDKEWQAGFLLEVGIRAANSKRVTQLNAKGDDNPDDVGFDLREAYWYAKHKTYGKGIVGISTAATDKITEANVTQTAAFAKYSDVEDTGLGMFLRSSVNGRLTDSGITWRRLIGDAGDQPGEGERGFNIIKYESPVLHGFYLTASLGTAEFWDVALRYEEDNKDFKFEAGVGYLELLDGAQIPVCAAAEIDEVYFGGKIDRETSDCQQIGGSFSFLHKDTGLFVNFGTGLKYDNFIRDTARFAGTSVDPGQFFWATQFGVEKNWFGYGKTTLYGEYYDYDGGGSTRRTVRAGDALNPTGIGDWAVWYTDMDIIGAGIAQGFDDAAMILYLSYRHVKGSLILRELNGGVASGAIADSPIDDLDVVITGAMIKF